MELLFNTHPRMTGRDLAEPHILKIQMRELGKVSLNTITKLSYIAD